KRKEKKVIASTSIASFYNLAKSKTAKNSWSSIIESTKYTK
ncbi:MAG: hypothetical protein ACI8P3_002398, partial [Saprospiraceae bacterium]